MGTLIGNNYDILNELYVGETGFIKKFIETVSKARAPYVGKMKKPIKGNKDFIKIGDMIAEEFGFHSVTFSVPFDVSMNAFTYPITMAIDETVVGKKPKFFQDKGLKYEESNGRLCTLIAVTAGVWFSPEISDREVVAAILHEVGHSFVLQSERTIDIIESNRLSIAYSIVYSMIMKIVIAMKNPVVLASLPNDIKTIMNASNKGKEIHKELEKQLAGNPLFAGVSSITEWTTRTMVNLFREIVVFFSGAAKIASIPFVALTTMINKAFAKPAIAISRSQEYLSDSFATMYGMGPEISSFLTKIEYSPNASGSKVDKLIGKIPVIGALHATLNIPLLLLSNSVSTHPSTPARINKILDELNKELKDSDLSPKTKEAIKKNIKDLEKIKAETTAPVDKKKYDAEMVRRMWIAYVSEKNETTTDLEDYYTDLKVRDKYVKEADEMINNVKLI